MGGCCGVWNEQLLNLSFDKECLNTFSSRAYEELGLKHEPLTLIQPTFETPLPPLQPAVSRIPVVQSFTTVWCHIYDGIIMYLLAIIGQCIMYCRYFHLLFTSSLLLRWISLTSMNTSPLKECELHRSLTNVSINGHVSDHHSSLPSLMREL